MSLSMRTQPTFLAVALLLTGAFACRKPQPIVPAAPIPTGPSEEELRSKAEEALKRQEALEAAKRAEEAAKRAQEAAKRAEESEKTTTYHQAAMTSLADIHFDFDKSDIKENDKERLVKIATFMRTYPMAKLEIQGHCDERGTIEYNIALGNRRASAALRYLAALGVNEERFTLISFGKESPLCTESEESCWSLNRRDHFELR